MKKLSVYLHIPFCVRKCRYCDFLSGPADAEVIEKYVKCLTAEIRQEAFAYKEYEIQTVFFGGGTPSLLCGEQIGLILNTLYRYYAVCKQPEITMEMNPGTVTKKSMKAYRESGVNRISIGLQSADNEELACLGRIHTWEDFLFCYEWSGELGFTNRNIDLMSGIPNQSMDSYRKTLNKVLALKPEHISAYSLIIEEETPFYELYKTGKLSVPDEKLDRDMYEKTGEMLSECGFYRYEISNYARKGYECHHNITYWKRGDYAGFGIGAASLVKEQRWSNGRSLAKYLDGKNIKENRVILSKQEQMEEFMFLGLRMMEGVSAKRFSELFGCSVDEVYGSVLKKLEQEKLLVNGKRIYLTDLGIDVSNYALADFLL